MAADIITRARRAARRRGGAVLLVIAAVAGATTVVLFTTAPHRSDFSPPVTSTEKADRNPVVVAPDLTADLTWSRVAGVAVPASRRHGPHDSSGGLARGFTHDPSGAVLAAVHIVVRATPQAGPLVFGPTLRDQVIGPDAAVMRGRVAQAYNETSGQDGAADVPAALLGYRIASYRADEAVLWLRTGWTHASGEQVRIDTTIRMAWTGLDWVLVAPVGGTFDSVVRVVPEADFDSFLPFGSGG